MLFTCITTLPNHINGISPIEVWTQTKSSYTALIHAHPWGCPAYVLDPRRQEWPEDSQMATSIPGKLSI